jgi:hypothetical protein
VIADFTEEIDVHRRHARLVVDEPESQGAKTRQRTASMTVSGWTRLSISPPTPERW